MRPDRTLIPVVLLAMALLGCKVTADDVEEWKGTVKGPGKIVTVMLSDNYSMDLRTRAAQALVEMERSDVNGVAELKKALSRLDDSTREEIVEGLIPELKEMMHGGDSVEGEEGPAPAQVQAKDAAYVLIPEAGPEGRKELTEAVVGWYAADFNGRSLAGNYSAEQVVRGLGAPAASQLVEALNPRMPQPALVKIAELIGELGEGETRKEAAERVVELQKEMEGDEFLGWLQEKITEELTTESEGEPDSKRVEAIAVLNREKFINEGALPAMKHLHGQKIVADRLLAIASTDSDNEMMVERRKHALQALEGAATEEQLDQYLALALDEDNPVPVRDYAFDRVGDIRSKKALPELWPLVQSTDEERLRWRAGELTLAIGGPDVVEEFFAKLPSGAKYPPEELEGYANRLSQMNPKPTDLLRGKLGSGDWWQRVVALEFLAREGERGDVARMKERVDDQAKPVGPNWPEDATVGTIAERSVQELEQQLAQSESAQQG